VTSITFFRNLRAASRSGIQEPGKATADLEGSGGLPAGQSAPGEIDEVVGDLGAVFAEAGRSICQHDERAACRRRWLR